MTVEIVLGPGRSAFPTDFPENENLGELSGQLAGFRVTHPRGGVEGEPECAGGSGSWIPTNADAEAWTLVSREPLHLEPSLLCRACGDHGWIRGGKWVPA